MKKVLVIIQDSPFNTLRASEGFRMTMGLSLADNEVSLLLMGDGVFNLLPLRAEAVGQPSIQTYLEYFPKMRIQLYAEDEALINREISSLPPGTRRLPRQEALGLISAAEVAIPFR
jgi:sulfur relay (sulfurtransferase) DsrF/TusC family protein